MCDERTARCLGDAVLALDPGVCDAGAAVLEQGRLTACWWLRPSLPLPDPCPVCVRRQSPCLHAAGALRRGALVAELLRQAGPLSRYRLLVTEGRWRTDPARFAAEVETADIRAGRSGPTVRRATPIPAQCALL